MDGSVLLDVTLGLALMYLLIALFCTALQEWVAQILNLRASHLRDAISALLSGGTTPSPEAKAVLAHPLFRMLADDTSSTMPSYCTSENFVNALLAKLVPPGTELTFATLQAAVNAIDDNPSLKGSLTAIVRQAEGLHSVENAEARLRTAMCGIQNWFDAAMDHASGWYKRRVRTHLLIIAGVIVLGTNADSIQVALKLAGEAKLRDQVAAVAATTAPVNSQANAQLQKLQDAAVEQIAAGDIMAGLSALPVGWQLCSGEVFSYAWIQSCSPGLPWPLAWLEKFVGLLLTALAAALGAPFWFGLLEQLNAIRSAGPRPVSTTTPPPS
jgi:hypothetical protein